jgi:hypothetical protein
VKVKWEKVCKPKKFGGRLWNELNEEPKPWASLRILATRKAASSLRRLQRSQLGMERKLYFWNHRDSNGMLPRDIDPSFK